MIALRIIETSITILSVGLAYVASATTAGYMQALAAKHMGDRTPEDAGFLTWNPIVHIDPIGALLLLCTGIGWRKQIPINHSFIVGNWRLAIVFFSHAFAHSLLMIMSLISIISLLGMRSLNFSLSMAVNRNLSLATLAKAYPLMSSLHLSVALFLISLLFLSLIFTTLSFIIDGFRFAMITIFKENTGLEDGDLITFLIPLVLILVFAPSLHLYLAYGVSYLVNFLAYLLGVS